MAEEDWLHIRLQELASVAEARGIDWKDHLERLPDDTRLRVAALATTLELDAFLALREDVSVAVLEDKARATHSFAQEAEKERRELLGGAEGSPSGSR